MYWGSVRFFKHLILLVLVLLIVSLSVTMTLVFLRVFTRDADSRPPSSQSLSGSENPQKPPDEDQNSVTEPPLHETLAGISPAYAALYPELYVTPAAAFSPEEGRVVYLTIEGPSSYTDRLLALLEELEVKATFFVYGGSSDWEQGVIRRISQAGHAIGIHASAVGFEQNYSSVEAFLEEFSSISANVLRATGEKPDIFRFAGGSINHYNRLIFRQLISEMTRRGYTYYDWDVDGAEFSADEVSGDIIAGHVLAGMQDNDRAFILLHDGPQGLNTHQALRTIIPALKGQGYRFETLDNTVQPYVFGYPLD